MDSTAIFDAVRSVTGAWARQRKAEERETARFWRRRDALVRSRRMTVREAASRIMPQAYLKASSNGTLPAHARQIMYAARAEIQRLAGRMLDDQYFTQQLLPDFMNEHPDATGQWDVVFDAPRPLPRAAHRAHRAAGHDRCPPASSRGRSARAT
jgi:hypothetical protein